MLEVAAVVRTGRMRAAGSLCAEWSPPLLLLADSALTTCLPSPSSLLQCEQTGTVAVLGTVTMVLDRERDGGLGQGSGVPHAFLGSSHSPSETQ